MSYPYGTSGPDDTPEQGTNARYPEYVRPDPQDGGYFVMPPPPPPAVQPPHRGRRALRLAVGTTAAALLLAGGVGIGTAIGESRGATDTTTSAQGQGQSTQDQQGQGQAPQSGPLYGGSQTGPQIFGQQGAQQGTGSTQTDKTAASGSQLTGLVRIQTELGYASGEAAGTGMVLTSDGEVVTNHHVVAGATKIQATVMSTGKTYTAKVVGTDTDDDVAVIQLEGASGLSTITADQDALNVGDAVTAVGDAGGTSSLSAAKGTVSALDQTIRTQSEGTTAGEKLSGLIEIDADVISGDSGGATYDGQGEVVGMTTAASSGSANITGYAIPISKVLSIVDDLRSGVSDPSYAYGYPAFLGIGLAQGGGATVQGVYDDTPAARAGLAAGDVITAIDGTPVGSGTALSKAIAAHQPGDSIRVTWTDQSGQSRSASVTLITGPVA